MNHPISFLLHFFFYLFLEKKAIESKKKLDIWEFVKYNFPINYRNVTE